MAMIETINTRILGVDRYLGRIVGERVVLDEPIRLRFADETVVDEMSVRRPEDERAVAFLYEADGRYYLTSRRASQKYVPAIDEHGVCPASLDELRYAARAIGDIDEFEGQCADPLDLAGWIEVYLDDDESAKRHLLDLGEWIEDYMGDGLGS